MYRSLLTIQMRTATCAGPFQDAGTCIVRGSCSIIQVPGTWIRTPTLRDQSPTRLSSSRASSKEHHDEVIGQLSSLTPPHHPVAIRVSFLGILGVHSLPGCPGSCDEMGHAPSQIKARLRPSYEPPRSVPKNQRRFQTRTSRTKAPSV